MPKKCLKPSDKSIFLIDIRRFQAKNTESPLTKPSLVVFSHTPTHGGRRGSAGVKVPLRGTFHPACYDQAVTLFEALGRVAMPTAPHAELRSTRALASPRALRGSNKVGPATRPASPTPCPSTTKPSFLFYPFLCCSSFLIPRRLPGGDFPPESGGTPIGQRGLSIPSDWYIGSHRRRRFRRVKTDPSGADAPPPLTLGR